MHLAYHVAVLGRVKEMPTFESLTAKALAKPPPPKTAEDMHARVAGWLGRPPRKPKDS